MQCGDFLMGLKMNNAKMIVIEGIEGAGKSSVLKMVQTFFEQKGTPFMLTREPGGTKVGEALRHILKHHQSEHIHDVTELLLMYASRTQLYHNVILPALAKGTWVISDRFELSSYAYQGLGRDIDLSYLKTLSTLCLNDFKPDLTLYLDVPYEVSQQRIQQRGEAKDRIEQEDKAFFNRIRQGYLSFASADNSIKIIDASYPLDEVESQVLTVLELL